MFYPIEFDPKPGIGRKQIADAYQWFANHSRQRLPQFKLIGLFYADLDAWNQVWTTDEEGRRLAQELGELAEGWDVRMLAKLL